MSDQSLHAALERRLGTLPVMWHDNHYPAQALPKADLLSLLALHPAGPVHLPRADVLEILNHYFSEYGSDDCDRAADALVDLLKHPVEGGWTDTPVAGGQT